MCNDESLAHLLPNSRVQELCFAFTLPLCQKKSSLIHHFLKLLACFHKTQLKETKSKTTLGSCEVFIQKKLVKRGWLVFSSEATFIKGYHPLSNSLLWDALIIWGFKIKKQNDALVDLLYNYTKRLWNLTASITLSCLTLRKITRHPGCVHCVIVKRKEVLIIHYRIVGRSKLVYIYIKFTQLL